MKNCFLNVFFLSVTPQLNLNLQFAALNLWIRICDFNWHSVANSRLVLRWMCDSPRAGLAWRITPLYMWHERAMIEYFPWDSCDLCCCLLPQCKTLRTYRSGFPIDTNLHKLFNRRSISYKWGIGTVLERIQKIIQIVFKHIGSWKTIKKSKTWLYAVLPKIEISRIAANIRGARKRKLILYEIYIS